MDISLPRAPVRAKKTMNIALLYWFGPQKNTDESKNILNRHDTEIRHFLGSNPANHISSGKTMTNNVARIGPYPRHNPEWRGRQRQGDLNIWVGLQDRHQATGERLHACPPEVQDHQEGARGRCAQLLESVPLHQQVGAPRLQCRLSVQRKVVTTSLTHS